VDGVYHCLPGGWTVKKLSLARRTSDTVWQLLDFQLNKYVGEWSFTVTLGVHDSCAAALLGWPSVNKEHPTIGVCQWRMRLSQLNRGTDEWIPLADNNVSNAICKDIAVPNGLEALDSMRDSAQIASLWESRPGSVWFQETNSLVLAALHFQGNEIAKAKQIATRVLKTLEGGPSEAWVRRFLKRLT